MTEKLYKAKVSYYETDCMNIVHHSNFIRYFEDRKNFPKGTESHTNFDERYITCWKYFGSDSQCCEI